MSTSGDRVILVLDSGTTSTRAMIYDAAGKRVKVAQQPIEQHYPQTGWVEHDAAEILSRTLACAREVVEWAGGADRIAAIGITNQRETVVAWDRSSGQPVSRALVWQDRRTAPFCDTLKANGSEDMIRQRTGLLADPYFSAGKMRWILHNVPGAAALGDRLAFGTVESWLVWNLTGGAHITDHTNASRTSLYALETGDWDAELAELFDVPLSTLPEVVPNCGEFGHTQAHWFGAPIAITGLIGDQQSAMIGQGCLDPGQSKATFGTGAFILTSTGPNAPRSANRLLTTVLYDSGAERRYAFEGSIFAAGSIISWLKDSLGVLSDPGASEALARSVPDNGGVVFVPALAGLGAPFWRPDATASFSGLSFATTRAHMVRAALESISSQCLELKRAFASDGADWSLLRVDGGMSANDWLAQDLADILDVSIERPQDVETTACGAAIMAAYGRGHYRTLADAVRAMRSAVRGFTPEMDDEQRTLRRDQWSKALTASLA